MSEQLRVRYRVPLHETTGNIVFTGWLPLQEVDVIEREADRFTIRLSLDRGCISSSVPVDDPEELSGHVNILSSFLVAEVAIREVRSNLAQFISDEREAPKGVHHGIGPDHPDYEELAADYVALGKEVHRELVATVNRLVEFARNEMGQYWLNKLELDPSNITSANTHFNAEVTAGGSDEWVRWCPPGGFSGRGDGLEPNRYLAEADWNAARGFVQSERRSDLVLELLANAEDLSRQGHRRSALIEGVVALEVCINRFARTPKTKDLRPGRGRRIDVNNLAAQVDHMGLTGTVRYLLPLLFTSEQMPDAAIDAVQEAVDLRGNVAHQGQRDVTEDVLDPLMRGIRRFIETMMGDFIDAGS